MSASIEKLRQRQMLLRISIINAQIDQQAHLLKSLARKIQSGRAAAGMKAAFPLQTAECDSIKV